MHSEHTHISKGVEKIKIIMTKEQELQLIKAAQNGDVDAENAVAVSYMNLAKSIARSFGVMADADDLAGYGMLGLMRAIRTYDENGKASFKTYASTCIRNAIVDALRKPNLDEVNIDEVALPESMQTAVQDPEDIFIENETSALLFDAITALLTPVELAVLKLHLECLSYSEIAKELGIEQKKVDNTIYSAKKKIKKLLKDE